ncbi:DUF2834 domain-containing protein [Mycobacterium sp. ML4]
MPGKLLVSKQIVYLALVLAGTAVPMAQFVPWLFAHGLDVPLFLHQLFANSISSFFAWDVILAVVTLLFLASVDDELGARPRAVVAAAALLGASVGLPMCLWLRERRRRRVDLPPAAKSGDVR